MASLDLTEAVIVVHPALTAISDEAITEALSPSRFQPSTSLVRLPVVRHDLRDLASLDWASEHNALLTAIEAHVRPRLADHSGPLLYFGMAPIPLAIDLGHRIATTRASVAFQQVHARRSSWRWDSEEQTVRVDMTGQPAGVIHAKGDVVIRVSCSHTVLAEHTRRVVANPIGELDVLVVGPHEDVLKSDADVLAVATKFGEALDCASNYYPHADRVCVFASVPPALAFRLGTEINPTMHRPVQTYQYDANGPVPYVPAIVVGARAPQPLTPEERDRAARARHVLVRSLQSLQQFPTPNAGSGQDWLADLLQCDCAPLPAALRRLRPLDHSNRAIVGAQVDIECNVADGEFTFDQDGQRWVLDDMLLAALSDNLSERELEDAGRLFFLHEAVHVAAQGLTSANAFGVGRLPRVLEDADYLADLWAVLHELGRLQHSKVVSPTDAHRFLARQAHLITKVLWAFDAASRPVRYIPIRRLNRYLIWHWQAIRLSRAATLRDSLVALGTKPVLEVSGPRTFVNDGRVLFDLDPSQFDTAEFGALMDGYRIVRIGVRRGASVHGLLQAIREGDARAFITNLEGIFDSASAG